MRGALWFWILFCTALRGCGKLAFSVVVLVTLEKDHKRRLSIEFFAHMEHLYWYLYSTFHVFHSSKGATVFCNLCSEHSCENL